MWLAKFILFLFTLLISIPIALLLIGWIFNYWFGPYIVLGILSVVGFISWRRRTEHFGGSEYVDLKSRIEWLREKDRREQGDIDPEGTLL